MAKTAACPSCGAPVVFRSAASIFAVCEFCQSTLVRHDQQLEDIGKMAALAEDRSPLQLGAEGRWQGVHFALIGRIQLRYSQGIWNEWHLLFDDMRTAWLSEAGGEYALTFLKFAGEQAPAFEELQVGQQHSLGGHFWQVTNIERAECIAGQGELPFKVGAGYPAPLVDLRDGDHFASLDYSESPPMFFVGAPVKFEALALINLRDGAAIPEINVQAQVFRCPSCGSPLSARSADIKSVGCAACGAVVDTSDLNYQLLSKALGQENQRYAPRLPVGSQGTLDGKPVEVIGFLVKQTESDGIAYDWREYLLAGENGTYRWLTEYDGHWNVADVLSRQPRAGANVTQFKYGDDEYRHFSTYRAEVIQVAGEFTWRVARGERAELADFVAPPLMLSRERSENEISWSQCRYTEPAEIQAAFKLPAALPEPIGVYANQPNPWEERHRRICGLFWKFFLVALVLHVIFLFVGGNVLMRQTFAFDPRGGEETLKSPEFEVKSEGKLLLVNDTDLSNNWISLGLTLVNKKTGLAFPASREIGAYSGVDSDGSWSEGSRDDEIAFVDIPPGTYYIAVDPDFSETATPVRSTMTVKTASGVWSNWFILLIYLAAFPIFSRLRRSAFEVGRWAESDHAPVASDADDDDDE
jgi:ribosomal protein L37AE/L43A